MIKYFNISINYLDKKFNNPKFSIQLYISLNLFYPNIYNMVIL